MPSGDAGERCGVHLLVRVYILRVVRDGDAGRVPELRRRAAAAAAQGMSAPRVGDPARAMLRHTLATVAYRAAKCLRGAPSEFATFRASSDTRTPGEMLAHMGDLIDWAQTMLKGTHEWLPVASKGWSADSARFHASMQQLDAMLASDEPLRQLEQVFQGPIADALCHTGQIALLRRLAGAPIRAENYAKADIAAGVVSSEQPASRVEFG